jgi:hypothetical protein
MVLKCSTLKLQSIAIIIKITINVIIENFTEDVEPMKDKTFPRYWGSMPSARS